MHIYLTEKNHQSLCKLFGIEYTPMVFDTIILEKNVNSGSLHPCYGVKLSEETKQKISSARKGIIFSLEQRKKMRESARRNKNFIGKKHSEEAKKRMSESAKKRTDRKKLRCSCIICHMEISNNHIGHHYKKHQ